MKNVNKQRGANQLRHTYFAYFGLCAPPGVIILLGSVHDTDIYDK